VLKNKNGLCKARLVARDFNFSVGHDASMFSPTPALGSLRFLIAHCSAHCHKGSRHVLRSCDVQTAFLNSPLEEETFVTAPDNANGDVVWRLDKALYGLRAAPKLWNLFLTQILLEDQWTQSLVDPCVFSRGDSMLFVHVDDLIISAHEKEMVRIFAMLRAKLLIVEQDMMCKEGDVNTMLGRTITRHEGNRFSISGDARLIDTSIRELKLSTCKSVSTPGTVESLEPGTPLSAEDHAAFRTHVGRLLYVSADRLDIAFCVKNLARRVAAPTSLDLVMLKRVLRYLRPRRTVPYIIQATMADLTDLKLFADSDWAGCKRTRKSTSGAVLMAGNSILTTFSRTQSTIALSSCEAELGALVSGTNEILFFARLAKDVLGESVDVRLTLYSDSKAALDNLVKQGVGRMKHISIRALYLQEITRRKIINIAKVPGVDNVSDLLTKSVTHAVHAKLMERLPVDMSSWTLTDNCEE
jgi:hypothetical protein